MSEEKSEKIREIVDKGIHLIAGVENNLNAIVDHFKYLENFTEEYLKKIESERDIKFDNYISDFLVVDLLIKDMATFIGHIKVISANAMSKMIKGDLTEDQQDKVLLKVLKIERDIEKIKDEEYYELLLDRSIQTIIDKVRERNLEGVVTENFKTSEGDVNAEPQ